MSLYYKKHYDDIAIFLYKKKYDNNFNDLMFSFIYHFENDNPKFDKMKFVKKCMGINFKNDDGGC